MRKQPVIVAFKVTPAEQAILEAAAQATGERSGATYARSAGLEAARRLVGGKPTENETSETT